MKRLLILLLILVVGCSKTGVIYLEDDQQMKQITADFPKQGNPEKNVTVILIGSNTTADNNQTQDTPPADNQTQPPDDETPPQDEEPAEPINPADEYTITSCCDEGRLFAQTKKEGSAYSEDDVKEILLYIYYDNCDNFDHIRQMVYLRYLNENQDTNYLRHHKDTSFKQIIINGELVTQSFETCD